ncbi:type VII toxin-antitoxin system MntA family adenylyltransferase antitoxin [Laspinema olomoucense]|uniref:type VII toxin-antitoxin system MntA family adenylyltransferase antitoxin n=1 Tax=Laspinema olomoucense TaxID=3231600 RepID=UPI0021BA6791|nr:nucleotidyltransferase domain-containing protein [Laspinema sp. D3a]MCT7988324.1 nucleotidyltransferase domain-containing protein [Laspinema sp. D3a]
MSTSTVLSVSEFQAIARQLPEQIPVLKMLVLFGSRVRGNFHAESDWDFAALYDETVETGQIKSNLDNYLELSFLIRQELGIPENKIDIVELSPGCSPLLAYNIAQDAKLIYEKEPGELTNFKIKTWKVYADTEKFRQSARRCIELSLQKLGV